MPDQVLADPYGGYYFSLEIDGYGEIAHFQECSGLKTVATVFEIEEGGLNGMTHKRPGQSRFENIVLRGAVHWSNALADWRDEYLQDEFKMRNGSVVVYSNEGKPLKKYQFMNAWPVSWEGPSLNSGASELAVETLELAHHGLKVTNG